MRAKLVICVTCAGRGAIGRRIRCPSCGGGQMVSQDLHGFLLEFRRGAAGMSVPSSGAAAQGVQAMRYVRAALFKEEAGTEWMSAGFTARREVTRCAMQKS